MGQKKTAYKSKNPKLEMSDLKKTLAVKILILILIHTLKSERVGSITSQNIHHRLSRKVSISNDRETAKTKNSFFLLKKNLPYVEIKNPVLNNLSKRHKTKKNGTGTGNAKEMIMEAIEDSDNDALMEEEEDDSDFDYDEENKQHTQQSNISSLTSLGSTNSATTKKKRGRPFGTTKKKNKHEIATRAGGGRGMGRGGGRGGRGLDRNGRNSPKTVTPSPKHGQTMITFPMTITQNKAPLSPIVDTMSSVINNIQENNHIPTLDMSTVPQAITPQDTKIPSITPTKP